MHTSPYLLGYQLFKTFNFYLSKLFFKGIQRSLWKFSYKKNNKIELNGLMLNCKLYIEGHNNTIKINKGCFLRNVNIKISGNNHSIIFEEGSSINEYGRIIIEDEGNELIVGEGTQINGCFLTLRDDKTKILIGKNCLFSAQVVIRTSDAHSITDQKGNRINPGKNVEINDHVWIGYGATILKGCHIGNDCVIGSNAVVGNQNIPSNSVVAGNPGKIVKSEISWDVNRI